MQRSSVKSVECRRLWFLLIRLSGGDGIRVLGRGPLIECFSTLGLGFQTDSGSNVNLEIYTQYESAPHVPRSRPASRRRRRRGSACWSGCAGPRAVRRGPVAVAAEGICVRDRLGLGLGLGLGFGFGLGLGLGLGLGCPVAVALLQWREREFIYPPPANNIKGRVSTGQWQMPQAGSSGRQAAVF
jgi:hypothetical protein